MRVFAVAACVLALTGCASVVRPFANLAPDYTDLPADDMRAVANEIETAVDAGNREPRVADRNGVVVTDPSVVQAIRTRAARAERLNQFRDTGFCFEKPDGLVEIRTGGEYSDTVRRKDRDRNALLVLSENQDRWTLYEGIMKSSKFPRGSLSAIQRIFFEERVKVMPSGQKYIDEAGNIATKP